MNSSASPRMKRTLTNGAHRRLDPVVGRFATVSTCCKIHRIPSACDQVYRPFASFGFGRKAMSPSTSRRKPRRSIGESWISTCSTKYAVDGIGAIGSASTRPHEFVKNARLGSRQRQRDAAAVSGQLPEP